MMKVNEKHLGKKYLIRRLQKRIVRGQSFLVY